MREASSRVVVKWTMGLHIRPVTRLVKIASRFSCEINLVKGDRICDAKHAIKLLTLAAGPDETIEIIAKGKDAEQAVEAIVEFFQSAPEEEGVGSTF